MDIGKLPNKLLEDIVISTIKNRRAEVVERSAIGKDCAIVDYGDKYCVLSSDPITGAEKNLGKIAVYVASNDIAAGGAEPIALLITILAPPETSQETIKKIMLDANEASSKLNIEIVGGHTEITNAVNRIVLSMTAVGIKDKNSTPDAAKIGDFVLMTKQAGMEGSTIIAEEKEKELIACDINQAELNEAKDYINSLSVLKEGMICANVGIKYMHDITEGGVEGAVWEASMAIGLGIRVNEKSIPVSEVTRKICDCFSINYNRLISSGAMLIICHPDKYDRIVSELSSNQIPVTKIGEVTHQGVYFEYEGEERQIEEPGSDELYKVI
ncbi:MAG: AIR synthase family protein [Eubacteriales bacterium]|nr:AIR synthase family protein [Eubacteriales bacterium]